MQHPKVYPVLESPKLPRNFKLWWHQWIAFPVILAIPILALCGVFGDSGAHVATSSRNVALSADYPKRMHYGQTEELLVTIKNITARQLDAVEWRR